MHGQGVRGAIDDTSAARQLAAHDRLLDEVRHGVVATWKHSEAEVDGDPTRLCEGSAVSERNHAARLEQLDLVT